MTRFFRQILRLVLLGALAPLVVGPAGALELELPALARMTASEEATFDSYAVAVSPWRDGRLELSVVEGTVRQQSWMLPSTSLTTLQILDPLRSTIDGAEYQILFECSDTACGGFDFRYAIDLLPEPEMHVNLGDFRYLAARDPDPGGTHLVLVISRSASAGYVHITRISPEDDARPLARPARGDTASVKIPARSGFATDIEEDGRVILEDLVFDRGSARLDAAAFTSLAALAGYLTENPERRLILVGHTDAEGALDSNLALSKLRAQSVVNRLIESHGIAPERLAAEGVGYLVPLASNTSEEGRATNRRVEAVLAGTE